MMMSDSEDPYISPSENDPYHRAARPLTFNNINGGGHRGGEGLF